MASIRGDSTSLGASSRVTDESSVSGSNMVEVLACFFLVMEDSGGITAWRLIARYWMEDRPNPAGSIED